MVRKVLRLLGSRYGIAAILLLAVIAVVAVAKANNPSTSGEPTQGSDPGYTGEEGAANDGIDEAGGPEPTGEALPSEAVDAATDTATAWVDTDGKSQQEWYDAVTVHATDALKAQLAETVPENVPATELRGDPVAEATSVSFETDAGLVILRMTQHDGNWYVDGIDFNNP